MGNCGTRARNGSAKSNCRLIELIDSLVLRTPCSTAHSRHPIVAPIRANASLRPLSAPLASLADKRHMLPISIELGGGRGRVQRGRGLFPHIKFYSHMHKVWHKVLA